MRALVLKEIASFFATITGYAVLVVFLALTSLFLWLFPIAPARHRPRS